jgi:hypothetical protein
LQISAAIQRVVAVVHEINTGGSFRLMWLHVTGDIDKVGGKGRG